MYLYLVSTEYQSRPIIIKFVENYVKFHVNLLADTYCVNDRLLSNFNMKHGRPENMSSVVRFDL